MKKYIQPSIVVTEVRALSPLAASGGTGIKTNPGSGTGSIGIGGGTIGGGSHLSREEEDLDWDIY